MFALLLIGVLAVVMWRATRDDLAQGLPLAAGLMVLLPGQLKIGTPGEQPEITIHRILLFILMLRWANRPREHSSVEGRGLLITLGLVLATHVVSTLISVTPARSVKDLLAFAFESVIYFYLACRALESPSIRQQTMRAMALGLTGVAAIAFVERYAGVSVPVLLFPHFHYCADGIQSTYPHRILLGYAMAMGAPLTLYVIDQAVTTWRRIGWWTALAMQVIACFLADSRGGWLGMALGGACCFVFGSRATQRRCLGLLSLAVIALLLRPGVRETIVSRINETYAQDSYRGLSYQYRWRLWHVAVSEIGRSPERLLFGYGGLSTETMDLSQYFRSGEGGTARKIGYTSWDNHYASDLIEFGVVGFGLDIVLYGGVLLQLLRLHRRGRDARPLIGATLAGAAIFLFARSNVCIFSEQLRFLFWTTVAIGVTALHPATVRAHSEETAPLLPEPAPARA